MQFNAILDDSFKACFLCGPLHRSQKKALRLRGKALPQVTITAIAGLVDVESFGGKL